MNKLLFRTILVLGFSGMTGCSFFTNKAKREVLVRADKELDALIADRNADCDTFRARLQGLKAKVKADMDSLK